jgi:hypothetical protein
MSFTSLHSSKPQPGKPWTAVFYIWRALVDLECLRHCDFSGNGHRVLSAGHSHVWKWLIRIHGLLKARDRLCRQTVPLAVRCKQVFSLRNGAERGKGLRKAKRVPRSGHQLGGRRKQL